MRVVVRILVQSDMHRVRVARRSRDLRRVYAVHACAVIAYRVECAPLTMPLLQRASKKMHLLIVDRMFHT